jgi:serine protease Do
MKRAGLFLAAAAIGGLVLSLSVHAQSGKVRTSTTAPQELSLVETTNGGYLGVFLGDVTAERAKELKLAEVRGAVVGKVQEDSPAAKAGLRENDVILAYNGQRVESAAQMHRLLMETPPGRSVTLEISRDGARQQVPVTLGERQGIFSGRFSSGQLEYDAIREMADRLREQAEEMRRKADEESAREFRQQSEHLREQAERLREEMERARREGRVQGFDSGRGWLYSSGPSRYHLGVSVTPLSEQLARFFNVKGGAGLLVTEVEAKSPAESAGLKAGDCITAVNGERVNSATELTRLLSRPGKDDKEASEVSLTVVRDRQETTIKAKPERRDTGWQSWLPRERIR